MYKQEVIKMMWENLSRLRGELGKRIRKQVRTIPMLKFFIDDTLDEVEHIDQLFSQLDQEEVKYRSMKEAIEIRKKQEDEIEDADL
jgi:ribosome-binding factor A